MPLNQKQYQYLDAMGINLWQQKVREKSFKASNQPQALLPADTTERKIEDAIEKPIQEATQRLNLTSLSQSQLFIDILQSINVSLGDISLNHNTLNLGWLNWEIKTEYELSLSGNTLRTPELSSIAKSNTMKAALWKLLEQQT